jgi:hypothetical protein
MSWLTTNEYTHAWVKVFCKKWETWWSYSKKLPDEYQSLYILYVQSKCTYMTFPVSFEDWKSEKGSFICENNSCGISTDTVFPRFHAPESSSHALALKLQASESQSSGSVTVHSAASKTRISGRAVSLNWIGERNKKLLQFYLPYHD